LLIARYGCGKEKWVASSPTAMGNTEPILGVLVAKKEMVLVFDIPPPKGKID
jgi:hypothetical protein